MSEPELLLYRSNLLGSDKRITNYGGGNTSAKVMEKDPLTGETVEVLWVKGSGGDVGTIKLDGFATLYMDKLERAEEASIAASSTKTRWSATCRTAPSTSTRARPRSTRRCTPSCRTQHVDHMHPDAIIAIAAAKNSQGADAGDLRRRDRLAAVEAARLRARPVARRNSARENPRPWASCSKATACSPGATRRRNATRPRIRIINQRDRLVRERDARARRRSAARR